MKTIVVLTDFSLRAEHAAFYALRLAQKVEADLLLCNVYDMVDISLAAEANIWSADGDASLEESSKNDLAELADRLNKHLDLKKGGKGFRPSVKCSSVLGPLANATVEITSQHDTQMVVISRHWGNALSTLLLGDHASQIIENAECPVLVVPYQMPFTGYNKISFATDINDESAVVLQALYGLARYFDSEILITHVTAEGAASTEEQDAIKGFFERRIAEVNHPKMYYRAIKNKSVAAGLSLLAENSDIDLLVLVHRKRNLFQKLFEGSVTHKLADNLSKPMLVFPASAVNEPLPA